MTRGGKRPGAGRPSLTDEPRRRITGSISMTAAEWAALDSYVVAHRLRGRGAAVAKLLSQTGSQTGTRKAGKKGDSQK